MKLHDGRRNPALTGESTNPIQSVPFESESLVFTECRIRLSLPLRESHKIPEHVTIRVRIPGGIFPCVRVISCFLVLKGVSMSTALTVYQRNDFLSFADGSDVAKFCIS